MALFVNIFFVFLGFLYLSKSLKRYATYVNHLSIFGFVWLFITLGTQFAYPDLVSIEVIVLYYLCWLCYIFGSSLFLHRIYDNGSMNKVSFFKIKILIFFLLIFCVISNWEILSLILRSKNLFAWAALRKSNGFERLESSVFFTLFQRAYLIFIPLGILLYKNNKLNKKILILLVLIGLVFSTLRFTRAPILNLFVILLISYVYIYTKKLSITSILSVICLLLSIFGGSMFILNKGGLNYNVLDDFRIYLFGGQVAYQDFLNGHYLEKLRYDVNNQSFDFINYILKKIGLIESYPSYVRHYSYRFGVNTNIYTYLDCFTYDFGLFGALAGSFFLGFFSDFVYHLLVKKSNIFVLIFYGYICYYNCFVFANNEFIRFSVLLTAFSLWVYNHLMYINNNGN